MGRFSEAINQHELSKDIEQSLVNMIKSAFIDNGKNIDDE